MEMLNDNPTAIERLLRDSGYPPPPDLTDGLTARERLRRTPGWARVVAETGGHDDAP